MRNTIILAITFSMLLLTACDHMGSDVMNTPTLISELEALERIKLTPTPTPYTEGTAETSKMTEEAEHTNEYANEQTNEEKTQDNAHIVPGVTMDMQKSDFWLEQYRHKDEVILSINEVKQYNINNFRKLSFLAEPANLARSVSGHEILLYIKELSSSSKSVLYDETGGKYQSRDYEVLGENLNASRIPKSVAVQYGLTVKRTFMRTWPTHKEAYENPENMRNDMFVETAVYPAEPIAVYHISEDGKWYFARIYNYMAWIPVTDVALCPLQELEQFLSDKERLIIKGALIHTPYSPDNRISGLQLDMGVTLPLENEGDSIYTVNFPVADSKGNLEYAKVMLPEAKGLKKGNPDYTTENVLKQAFMFLGETYGWGGMNNARDCSAFILDIYRTFGIKLPRNTGQQEQVQGAISLKDKNRQERLTIIGSLRPGTALYMPGHAMIYLGKWQNRHYIIHDAATVYEKAPNGSLKRVVLYKVTVTPLDVYTGKGVEYLMALTTAVEFK